MSLSVLCGSRTRPWCLQRFQAVARYSLTWPPTMGRRRTGTGTGDASGAESRGRRRSAAASESLLKPRPGRPDRRGPESFTVFTRRRDAPGGYDVRHTAIPGLLDPDVGPTPATPTGSPATLRRRCEHPSTDPTDRDVVARTRSLSGNAATRPRRPAGCDRAGASSAAGTSTPCTRGAWVAPRTGDGRSRDQPSSSQECAPTVPRRAAATGSRRSR